MGVVLARCDNLILARRHPVNQGAWPARRATISVSRAYGGRRACALALARADVGEYPPGDDAVAGARAPEREWLARAEE